MKNRKIFINLLFLFILPVFLFSQPRVWQNVGMPGFSIGGAAYVSLFVYNNTPYVAYSDSGNSGKATVMRFDGSKWVSVGNKGFSDGSIFRTSLYVYGGTPYLAYDDGVYLGKATVMKYDGINWVSVGNKGFSDDDITYYFFKCFQ